MTKDDSLRDSGPPRQGRGACLSALDASLAAGLADAEAGRIKLAVDVFDRLEDKYRRLANRTA